MPPETHSKEESFVAVMTGIDVSEHNGTLNWTNIKAAGVAFAIIRSGYGVSHTDLQFKANVEGAIAQNIPFGIYHFSYALTTAGAEAEAEFVLSLLKPYRGKVRLPVFFDFEYDTIRYAQQQGITLGRAAFNSHTLAFCKKISAGGYKGGTYYNLDFLTRYVDKAQLAGLPVWYAQYSSSPSISDYDIWQYTSKYTIPGGLGQFDGNILKNTALLEPLIKAGWQKNDKGWWYVHEDGSYTTSDWEKIDGKWYYFDGEGYMLEDKWVYDSGNAYYMGESGAMVTNRILKLNEEGRLTPAGAYYYRLGDVPKIYRETLDRLVERDILKGSGGQGDDLILDMSEDSVRVLVLLERAGAF